MFNKILFFCLKDKTIRTLHQIHIHPKTSRVWNFLSEMPHRRSNEPGLDFVNLLFTQCKTYLLILMENNRNHQITLNKGIIGYSSLDILDYDRPNYQIRDCVQMVNSIFRDTDKNNEFFLLRSTVPCKRDTQDKIQILHGNGETIIQANNAIAHCISSDAKMSKIFAATVCRKVNGLQEYCHKAKST